MRDLRSHPVILASAIVLFLLAAAVGAGAQDKRESFSVIAFGTSTQLGQQFDVKILIESYSTPDDQRALLEAFQKRGNEGLVDALERMPARGRISTPGTLGYDIKYIRVWSTPTGRRIRILTNRTIAFGEVRGNTRSRDYSVSALEMQLDNNMNKSTGTLMPACQFQVSKQGELEIEAFQNPWRLGNFIDWNK